MAAGSELKRAGLGAAREARALLAALVAKPEAPGALSDALSSTIGGLYGAELGDARQLADALREAMDTLGALAEREPWASDPEVSRGLSRALATLHAPHAALARGLGRERDDATAPFPLTSTRVKASRPPGAQAERRDDDRHVLEVDVGLEGASRFYTGRTGDLGRGGLFVASDDPLPVGTSLLLSFVLPDGYRVRAGATVAWVRAPRYRPHELPSGMGVRFDRLSDADLHAIRHFLEQRPPFHYGG
ncbi:MAG TPA: PilZ domain-containing protein [Sandaracinaceae bacterium LLY-WYZ-13_1]|nr:PilZ domain-containing protein [Sandaracinaceae bacterium LLY-WYZ-13_1]